MKRPQTSINTGLAAIFTLFYLQKSRYITFITLCKHLLQYFCNNSVTNHELLSHFRHNFLYWRTHKRIPRTHNSTHMASQTPCRPHRFTRRIDKVILTPHILIKFRRLGPRESPAPLRAPAATMDTPYKGSANNSIRSTSTASFLTRRSGVSS